MPLAGTEDGLWPPGWPRPWMPAASAAMRSRWSSGGGAGAGPTIVRSLGPVRETRVRCLLLLPVAGPRLPSGPSSNRASSLRCGSMAGRVWEGRWRGGRHSGRFGWPMAWGRVQHAWGGGPPAGGLRLDGKYNRFDSGPCLRGSAGQCTSGPPGRATSVVAGQPWAEWSCRRFAARPHRWPGWSRTEQETARGIRWGVVGRLWRGAGWTAAIGGGRMPGWLVGGQTADGVALAGPRRRGARRLERAVGAGRFSGRLVRPRQPAQIVDTPVRGPRGGVTGPSGPPRVAQRGMAGHPARQGCAAGVDFHGGHRVERRVERLVAPSMAFCPVSGGPARQPVHLEASARRAPADSPCGARPERGAGRTLEWSRYRRGGAWAGLEGACRRRRTGPDTGWHGGRRGGVRNAGRAAGDGGAHRLGVTRRRRPLHHGLGPASGLRGGEAHAFVRHRRRRAHRMGLAVLLAERRGPGGAGQAKNRLQGWRDFRRAPADGAVWGGASWAGGTQGCPSAANHRKTTMATTLTSRMDSTSPPGVGVIGSPQEDRAQLERLDEDEKPRMGRSSRAQLCRPRLT